MRKHFKNLPCQSLCASVPISLYITITQPNEKMSILNFRHMILGVRDLLGIFHRCYTFRNLWKISQTFRDFLDTLLLSYLLEIDLVYLKYIERLSKDISEIFRDLLGHINYILDHAQRYLQNMGDEFKIYLKYNSNLYHESREDIQEYTRIYRIFLRYLIYVGGSLTYLCLHIVRLWKITLILLKMVVREINKTY